MASFEYDDDIDLDAISDRIIAHAPVALAKAMEYLRGTVVPKVPVETGHLAGSAGVKVDGLEATITFPGPYARYQHYELQLRHTTGQALYLEQPMVQEADEVLRILAEELWSAI